MRAIAIAMISKRVEPLAKAVLGGAAACVLLATATATASAQTQPQQGQPPAAQSKAKAGAKAKADPTAAQAEVEAGVNALGAGRAEAAVNHLNTAITSGTLPSAQSARALYYRGVAHRRTNKPAQAISDLTNALWIKNGLTPEQREDALRQRSAAYRDAGLPEQGEPPGHASAKAAAPAKGVPANATPFSAVAPAPPAAPSSTGSFFSSLFGGSSASNEPAPAAVARAPAPAPSPTTSQATGAAPGATVSADPSAPKPPTRVVPITPTANTSIMGFQDGVATPREVEVSTAARARPAVEATKDWAVATEVKTAAAGSAAKGKAAAGGPATGSINVLVAAVASADQARSVAQRVQQQYAADLAGRVPTVDQTATGAGLVYRVQVGPFATARDTAPLCAKLKSGGLDCRVMAP